MAVEAHIDPWLSPDQIERMTGKKQPAAQIRVLAKDRIPHKVVAGRPLVMREDLYESKEVVKLNL